LGGDGVNYLELPGFRKPDDLYYRSNFSTLNFQIMAKEDLAQKKASAVKNFLPLSAP